MLRVTGSSTCNAEVSRTCDKQTSTTTNVVECWWHRVFLRQRTVVDADHPWVTDRPRHKFSAVKRLSWRLLDQSKNAIVTYLICIWCLRWGDPIGDVMRRKTRVSVLSCGVVCIIQCLVVLIQLRLTTDRRTDRWCDDSKHRASIALRG